MAKRSSQALKFGFLGALTGLMDAKVSEWRTRAAEEAEMRKLERLEQLKIAAEQRAEERGIAAEGRGQERWFEQFSAQEDARKQAEQSRQDHDVALEAMREQHRRGGAAEQHGFRMEEQDDQQSASAAEAAANRETQLKIAGMRAGGGDAANDGVTYVNQTTGQRMWVPRGQVAPQGFVPEVGYGSTFAPSASKSNAPAASAVRPPNAASKPRDYSGFSIVQ